MKKTTLIGLIILMLASTVLAIGTPFPEPTLHYTFDEDSNVNPIRWCFSSTATNRTVCIWASAHADSRELLKYLRGERGFDISFWVSDVIIWNETVIKKSSTWIKKSSTWGWLFSRINETKPKGGE